MNSPLSSDSDNELFHYARKNLCTLVQQKFSNIFWYSMFYCFEQDSMVQRRPLSGPFWFIDIASLHPEILQIIMFSWLISHSYGFSQSPRNDPLRKWIFVLQANFLQPCYFLALHEHFVQSESAIYRTSMTTSDEDWYFLQNPQVSKNQRSFLTTSINGVRAFCCSQYIIINKEVKRLMNSSLRKCKALCRHRGDWFPSAIGKLKRTHVKDPADFAS